MFCVCEVIDEGGKSVEVIPESWIFGKPDKEKRVKCFWPPVKNPAKYVSQRKKPEQDWKSYAARVLRKYDCYQNARQALPRAEDTSDWSEPDATPKRKRVSVSRRAAGRLEHDSSEDEFNHAKGGLKRLPEAPKFVCVQAGNDAVTGFQINENESRNDLLFNIEDVREVLSMNQEEGDDHSTTLHRESQGISDSETMTSTHTSPSVGLGSSGPNNEQNADSTVVDLLKKLVLDSGVIKRTLQNIEGRLEKLETYFEHRVQTSGQSCVDSCLIPHPFSTVADFQVFDTFLDDDKKEVLKRELLRCGGDTTVEFIGRAMKKLMTNEVGLKYSLWGFRNNINFSKTAAWEVVKDSALSFKRINSTEKAIEKSVSEWFRHSGDRIKQQNNKLLIKPSGSTSTN
ncbi:hypothetical protein Ocin01_17765 [Orchesella cincta]|uniref:DUF4806 domain-containing protein n=1 Tax=Orchesella cincta TaxID=48709 RepID=A0A1D2M7H5_ORCCI|nr:hypothetical protein Ocin01_17765 [Orchesella cincta]